MANDRNAPLEVHDPYTLDIFVEVLRSSSGSSTAQEESAAWLIAQTILGYVQNAPPNARVNLKRMLGDKTFRITFELKDDENGQPSANTITPS